MAFNIGKFILGLFANSAIDVVDETFEQVLDSFYTNNPKNAQAFAIGMYVGVDGFIEEWVKKTKTPYDDKGVAELKKDLEEFAAAKGFTLPNIDAGTPND